MKVLITGGAGFLGLHVTDLLLARGIDVRVLDNFSTSSRDSVSPQAEVIEGDVCDTAAVDRVIAGVDGVVHLAAISSIEAAKRNWAESNAVNVDGTVNVFGSARKRKGAPLSVVYASSAAVYGTDGNGPLSENLLPTPISSYGIDKLQNEREAKAAFARFGLPSVGLRIFNAFGPALGRSNAHKGVISNFCSAINAGRAVTIYGDGQQTRDFVHAEDVARAILLSLGRQNGAEIFNICSGVETSIMQIAIKIAGSCAKELRVAYQSGREGEIVRSVGCPRRASAELGFEATIDLDDGLSRLLARPIVRADKAAAGD